MKAPTMARQVTAQARFSSFVQTESGKPAEIDLESLQVSTDATTSTLLDGVLSATQERIETTELYQHLEFISEVLTTPHVRSTTLWCAACHRFGCTNGANGGPVTPVPVEVD